MSSRFIELSIDCADPGGLARFWCAVLDYEVHDEDDEIVTIGPSARPDGEHRRGPVPPTLTFARVPEGKTLKNRLHIDLSPADREQDDEVRRLLDLGARPADVGQGDQSWVVLTDPEGNEFCVLAGLPADPGLSPVAVGAQDVRELALSLPRTEERLVRDQVRFRVGRLVYLSLSSDETVLGVAYPKEHRDGLVAAEPHKFRMPPRSEQRWNWVRVVLAELDHGELHELVVNAWAMCAPRRVVDAHLGAP